MSEKKEGIIVILSSPSGAGKTTLVKKEEMSLEDGKNINPVQRSTPTHGSEYGFFDQIIGEFRLNRVEILVLMYLYRLVWCKPNQTPLSLKEAKNFA